MSATFLDSEELAELTGKKAKGKQIEALRRMGLPFFVNSTGHPVVPRSVLPNTAEAPKQQSKPAWVPRVLKAV